jgi:hypothetical protein
MIAAAEHPAQLGPECLEAAKATEAALTLEIGEPRSAGRAFCEGRFGASSRGKGAANARREELLELELYGPAARNYASGPGAGRAESQLAGLSYRPSRVPAEVDDGLVLAAFRADHLWMIV